MAIQTQQTPPIWEILSMMAGVTIGGICGPFVMAAHIGIPGASALGAFLLGASGYGVPSLFRLVRSSRRS